MTGTRTAVVIVAAGRGSRAQVAGSSAPKQYRHLGGTSVLSRTFRAFADAAAITLIQPVIHRDDHDMFAEAGIGPSAKMLAPVDGGTTRQASVLAGLGALAGDRPDKVLIHDGARPFVDAPLIQRVIQALDTHAGAIPALPVADTLKRGQDGLISETVARDDLYAAQTPQGFRYDAILAAHEAAASNGRDDFTDDAALAEWHGLDVAIVQGAARNTKLTTSEDFLMAELSLSDADPVPGGEWRSGHGFDVHGFADGDHVTLCGVDVPHNRSLHGHSDADVAMHALTDAILGAIGDGDIGSHYPPSDPQWKGAASHIFLSGAAARVADRRGRIVNVDVTIICEAPRIGPHRDAMRARLAEILEIDIGRISVKATTTEGLGFTGRREGIAAEATASVWLP